MVMFYGKISWVINMKYYMPDFYKNFKCTADKCVDTCCKDWEIVIDEDTEKYYKSVCGILGEKLRNNIVTDSDGDRIFLLNDKKECPFLDKDRLCAIQKELGENALCKTCRQYPKLTLDFTEFTEYMLSFACPEAVRIIMKSKRFELCDIEPVSNEDNGYSNEMMNFLITARKYTVKIFMSSDPFEKKLREALAYTEYVQELLYNANFDISLLDDIEFTLPEDIAVDRSFVFDLFSSLDIMDESFRIDIENARNCKIILSKEIEEDFCRQSLYYIGRYYLKAIETEDVISCLKSIWCAYVVISSLIEYYNATDDFERRVMIIEKYSREIEHSIENTEIMENAFFTLPDFSTVNLINTLTSTK